MKRLISIIFLLNVGAIILAQDLNEVTDRFVAQLTEWPHEKIYLQTDKSDYLSGERVWLRSHLVEATSNIPAFVSRYVYIELFSPFDILIQRIKIRPDSMGVYSGYLDLDEKLPEGSYTIRAYTRYMRNQGNEAFFKKTIQVLDPYSLQIDPLSEFIVNGNKVKVNFSFVDRSNGATIVPEIVTFQLQDEMARRVSPDANNHFSKVFSFSNNKNMRTLLLGIVHNKRKYNRYYTIPYDTNDFDITFHPEGGYLVPGQPCRVGFKAINPSGLSEEVRGTLFNSKDEEILTLESLKFGMGFFRFTPEANEKYYAVCRTKGSDPKRINLPIPDIRSRTISAEIGDDHRVQIFMRRGNAAPEDSVSILVHHKGVVYLYQLWQNQSLPYSLAANDFPTGIIHILLLSNKNEILSERMVFNLNANDFAAVDTGFSSPSYKRRQLVSLKLHLTDSDTTAFTDNMAVSVTDKSVVRQDTTTSLLSSLLLSSELKGFIESPASYFDGYAIADRFALDALMMTQGWRRYNIPEILQGKINIPDKFSPEQFQEIKGRAEILFGGLKEANISLYAALDSMLGGEVTVADEKGRFLFEVEYPEGTEITIQSLSKKGGKNNLINIDMETFPDSISATIPQRGLKAGLPAVDWDDYLKKANEEYSLKNGIRTIMLDEVTVTAPSLENNIKSRLYSPIFARGLVTADEIKKRKVRSLRSLLASTPGIRIGRDEFGGDIVTTLRSPLPVLFVVNDIKNVDFAYQIDSFDVGTIDNLFILKDNMGMLGHYPNTHGAVVITTKKGVVYEDVKPRNIDRIKPLGYQLPVEFYTPSYEIAEEIQSSSPDLRTTIFWKPDVQFSKEGEALVEFYSADTPTTYQIIGEGVTSSGKMIRLDKEITIEGTY